MSEEHPQGQPSPLPPARNGARSHDGKFAKGNSYGKGNPTLQRIHALRAKLLGSISDAAMGRIAKTLVKAAEAGDMDAVKILLTYSIGKPPASLALTDPDGGPLGGDLAALQQVILTTLTPHPEARYAVARALLNLRKAGDGRHADAGDGA
jgi:hypothetical protein